MTEQSCNHWRMVLLTVSLVVNVALIGVLVGQWTHRPVSPMEQARMVVQKKHMANVPKERRPELKAHLKSMRSLHRELNRDVRDVRRELIEVFKQDVFDEVEHVAAVERMRAAKQRMTDEFSVLVRSVAADTSGAERRILVQMFRPPSMCPAPPPRAGHPSPRH